jgi:Protein of unknown function (DUF1706)
MPTPLLKDRLIQTLEAARIREQALLTACDDAPSPVAGQWTAKDNIAHLNEWREYATRTIEAVRLGQPIVEPPDAGDLDARNEVIYQAHRGDPAARVITAVDETYTGLIDAIAECTEEDLLRDRPGNAGPLWRIVPGNGHTHVSQHLSYYYAEHGDPAAAEDAAVWAHSLEIDLFPDPVERAAADYNLACYYGRTDRAAMALPLLTSALSSRPELRTWAAEDPDLDPIREQPEVRAVLTG